MVWKQLLLVSCLSAAMFLSMLQEGSSASVGVTQASGQEAQEGVKQKVFVPESDALNFLRRHGRRSPRPRKEIIEENRQHPGADEQQIEYYEEQQNEYENLAEEQIDEDERSRHVNEPWRHRYHDGRYPPYLRHRHRRRI